ncbi:endonuclease/exonuclease/phosphatase family protein [Frischella perrara]|uniref:endonuclease/exonuclease/phosphatase family protein n=1 Tax=Frischella perrara TaxID=1267021 RepID=UPI0023F3B25E|nr:endonuclease/exonuclease/phosphatase family protein [Frischella perrara]MCT6875283.1 endonuclease/exonuclease/phosphatase family protein [Frischella perrara]
MQKKSLIFVFIGLFSLVFNTYAKDDLVESQYYSSPNKMYPNDKQPEITIANYNIAGGLRKHKMDLDLVAKAIKSMDADIVTLEEVDQNTTRSGNLDQAKILAEKVGMYYVFGKATDMDSGNYGNAILSKYPIEKTKIFPLPSGDFEQRALMLSKINVPGFDSPIYIFNTHFDWHEEDDVRLSQARFINSIVFDDLDLDEEFPNLVTGIMLLLGDFNSVKNDRVIKELEKYWSLVKQENVDTRTWPAGNPGLDLDHIFTSRNQKWYVEKLIIPNDGNEWNNVHWPLVSDHIPVIAKLKLVEQ